MLQRGFQLQINRVVRFAKVLSPLRVTDNYVSATNRGEHGWRNLPGERAFISPVNVLGSDCDRRPFRRLQRRLKSHVRRTDNNLITFMAPHQRQKFAEEFLGLRWVLVHLPVRSDQFLAGHSMCSSVSMWV